MKDEFVEVKNSVACIQSFIDHLPLFSLRPDTGNKQKAPATN